MPVVRKLIRPTPPVDSSWAGDNADVDTSVLDSLTRGTNVGPLWCNFCTEVSYLSRTRSDVRACASCSASTPRLFRYTSVVFTDE